MTYDPAEEDARVRRLRRWMIGVSVAGIVGVYVFMAQGWATAQGQAQGA